MFYWLLEIALYAAPRKVRLFAAKMMLDFLSVENPLVANDTHDDDEQERKKTNRKSKLSFKEKLFGSRARNRDGSYSMCSV